MWYLDVKNLPFTLMCNHIEICCTVSGVLRISQPELEVCDLLMTLCSWVDKPISSLVLPIQTFEIPEAALASCSLDNISRNVWTPF